MRNLLSPIASIATNTFREAIRNKVLGSLLFFVFLSAAGTALLGEMSLHEEQRVTADGVLFMSSLFSVAIAVYSTVTLLHHEIERRTIYTILSKPISRWQFLLGKFFGVALLLFAIVILLAVLAVVLFTAQGGTWHPTLGLAYFTLYLQLLIVAAVTLLFASFSSPLLSGMFTVAIFVAGNLIQQLEDARAFLREQANGLDTIVDGLLFVLPNFQSLNLSPLVAHLDPVPGAYVSSAVVYVASYCLIALGLSIAIFSRRDFG